VQIGPADAACEDAQQHFACGGLANIPENDLQRAAARAKLHGARRVHGIL
jgi:hypothetical protein